MPKGKNKIYCDKCKRYTNRTHKYKNQILCTRCYIYESNDNFCKKAKIKSLSEFFSLLRFRKTK